jgi:hypothetical protein
MAYQSARGWTLQTHKSTNMRTFLRAFLIACATVTAAAGAAELYLADAIKAPAYAQALTKLLRSAGHLPDWTAELTKARGDYVGTPVDHVTIAGTRYDLFNACKAHDCGDNRLEVMFAPNGTQAWAAIRIDGKDVSFLGAPSPAQQAELKKAMQP